MYDNANLTDCSPNTFLHYHFSLYCLINSEIQSVFVLVNYMQRIQQKPVYLQIAFKINQHWG